MDSVTQFTLGAAVSVAVMRRRMPVWQSALWGGLCGTLPDLDALIDHGNALSNMLLHRAHSHALIWQTAATPVIAGILMVTHRVGRSRPAALSPAREAPQWRHWCLMVWLVLITHALLDGLTIYGTQLARPLSDSAYGLGSIFIIDPLYTVPLLAGVLISSLSRSPHGLRSNTIGLILSSLYLAWSAAAQLYVTQQVEASLAANGARPTRSHMLVTPTPFNTVLWRVVVMHQDRYDEGFYSLLDGRRPVRFSSYPIDPALRSEAMALASVKALNTFSDGFTRIDEQAGVIRITDLRMGQEPAYVFSFVVAQRGSALTETPPRAVGGRGGVPIAQALDWLWRRAAGADIDPPR